MRCVNASGTFSVRGLSYGIVEQLGTTDVSQFVGSITNTWSSGNTYPSGTLVVNNNALYQANSSIPAGTPFVVGTTGDTYSLIGASSSLTAFAKYKRGAGQGLITNGTIVICDVPEFATNNANIGVNITTGIITLQPGITYRLRGSIPTFTTTIGGGSISYGWFNQTTSSYVGQIGAIYVPSSSAAWGATGGAAEFVFTPTVVTQMSFRVINANGINIIGGNTDFTTAGSWPWIEIEQLLV